MALTKVSRGLLSTSIVDNGNATAITIDSSENVGIGTSSPNASADLHVADTSDARIWLEATSGDTMELYAGTNVSLFNRSNNALTFGTNNTERLRIDSGGNAIFTKSGGAYLQLKDASAVRGAINVTTSDGLVFTTGSSFTERLRITSAGAVSIGSSSATARLEVTGAFGYASGANSLGTTVSKAAARIRGSSDATTSLFFGSMTNDAEQYIQSTNHNGSGADDIALNPFGGNVGIGRIPRVMLDVAGEVAIAHNATYGLRFYNQPQNNWSSIGNPDTSSSAVLAFKDASGEAMRLDGNRRLVIGKTSHSLSTAGHAFDSSGYVYHTRSGDIMWLNRLGGHGTCLTFMKDDASVGTISTNANSLPSDRNFKTNINDLALGLDFVTSLKPVTYNYKIDDTDDPVMSGLIAQDVEESLDAAGVAKNSMTMLQHKPLDDEKQSDYQIDYLKLVPVLINAIKEQQTTITDLTTRLTALENN